MTVFIIVSILAVGFYFAIKAANKRNNVKFTHLTDDHSHEEDCAPAVTKAPEMTLNVPATPQVEVSTSSKVSLEPGPFPDRKSEPSVVVSKTKVLSSVEPTVPAKRTSVRPATLATATTKKPTKRGRPAKKNDTKKKKK